jgi:GT2 family glycosyltransferase
MKINVVQPTINKKILIAIPTAKNIEPATFKAIYDLEIPEGYTVDFQYFYGYAVDQVRNLIASWVVNNYDYLFAVDHDIAFAPDTLKKMIAHDKHVVSGIYRQRLEPQIIEIYDASLRNIPYESLPANSLLQIGGCGFGCALVKKEVLADIGYPQFVYHQALDHRHTFSEDLDFCKKATEKSYTIWVDTSILCDHYGDRIFKVS